MRQPSHCLQLAIEAKMLGGNMQQIFGDRGSRIDFGVISTPFFISGVQCACLSPW